MNCFGVLVMLTMAAVCLAKTVQSASLADSEADLLGLESAAPIVSVPSSAALNLPILPLAPQKFRPKRKPQRFRFDGERNIRFKPRNTIALSQAAESRNEVETEEERRGQTTTAPETTQQTQRTSFIPQTKTISIQGVSKKVLPIQQLRRKLPSFPKRRPTFFDTTTVPNTEAPTTTTTTTTTTPAPTTTTEQVFTVTERFETTRFDALEDLFGTAGRSRDQIPFEIAAGRSRDQKPFEIAAGRSRDQQPFEIAAGRSREQLPVEIQPKQAIFLDELVQETGPVALPPIVSNTIDDSSNLLDQVRARTVAITGAKSVGVTRNQISARGKSARLLKATTGQRRVSNGGSGGRRNRFRGSAGASGDRSRGQVSAPAQVNDFQVAEERLVLDTAAQDLDFASERRVAAAPESRNIPTAPRNPQSAPRNPQSAPSNLPEVPPTNPRSGGSGGRRQQPAPHKVGTVENYRFENEDGSITWGYENEDGSYKEESIGVDCITRGKYGYIDPTGEVREYAYSSGVKCDPLTRKVESDRSSNNGDSGGRRGINRLGVYDYNQKKFIMPDGRKVRVVVNQKNRARGRRH